GDEDLVEADRGRVRGDEVVPGDAGEELTVGRRRRLVRSRRDRIDPALHADVAEVGADAGGRAVRARVHIAVAALLATVEDQLTEAARQTESRGEDVEDLFPLVRSQSDDVVERLLRPAGAGAVDDGDADRIAGEIRNEH